MRIILVLLFLTSIQLLAQNKFRPLIKAGYHQIYLNNLNVAEIEVGAGVQFNDYISAQINFRGSQQRVLFNPENNFQIATCSIESSYRILGNNSMFSPVIAYDAGIVFANNGSNRLINMDNYVYSSNYLEPYNQYNKGLYAGKAKLMLSVKWKGFDLLLGGTYSTYFFKINYLKPFGPQSYPASASNKYVGAGTIIDGQFGFGFETSLKYTFPMKKRAAKKALD